MKNLSAAEMYDQVENLASIASEEYDVNLSNIVYMGMESHFKLFKCS